MPCCVLCCVVLLQMASKGDEAFAATQQQMIRDITLWKDYLRGRYANTDNGYNSSSVSEQLCGHSCLLSLAPARGCSATTTNPDQVHSAEHISPLLLLLPLSLTSFFLPLTAITIATFPLLPQDASRPATPSDVSLPVSVARSYGGHHQRTNNFYSSKANNHHNGSKRVRTMSSKLMTSLDIDAFDDLQELQGEGCGGLQGSWRGVCGLYGLQARWSVVASHTPCSQRNATPLPPLC